MVTRQGVGSSKKSPSTDRPAKKSKTSSREDFLYAREKLGVAVRRLAVGNGTLRVRLEEAYKELAVLRDVDLPDELVAEHSELIKALTSPNKMQLEGVVREGKQLVKQPVGTLRSTLKNMRIQKMEELAARIVSLNEKLEPW